MTMSPMPQPVESLHEESWLALSPACIICLGNELACDDGVGIQIGRCLCTLPLPSHVTVRFCPQIDLDLIDYLLTAQRVVFCDATQTGLVAGTVSIHDWQSAASWSTQPYCCHGIGLSDLVKITSELAPRGKDWDIHLVGVEARVLDKFGLELSDDVHAAVPKAVVAVLRLLDATDDLIPVAEEAVRQVRISAEVDLTTSWLPKRVRVQS